MWKLLVGFVLFAALAIFIMSKGGNIDMSGEKHDVTAPHAVEESASGAASAAAPAAMDAASQAVAAPASAASN